MTLARFLLGLALAAVLFWADGFFGRVHAQQWVTATVASKHLMDGDYNEFNPGLGIEYRVPETDWAVVTGFYHNSNKEMAVYAGGAYSPLKLDLGIANASLGVMGAMFWGYGSTPLPGVALIGSLERKGYGINLLYFPPKDEGNGLLALQVKWRTD